MYSLKITGTTGGLLRKNCNRRILFAPCILMILSYVTHTCIASFLPVVLSLIPPAILLSVCVVFHLLGVVAFFFFFVYF